MSTIRSFTKPFEMVDYTEALISVPNQWGLVNELGIFRNESIAQHSITIEKIDGTLGLITDQFRGTRNLVNKDDTRQLLSFAMPHFPLDDYISPNDVQGKRAYGNADTSETEAAVMARKMTRIRQNHAQLLETARCYSLTNGAIFAPSGTVTGNYYTSFGVTRKDVNFVLNVGTTDVISKNEEVIAHIQDNILSGESVNNIIGLCSPGFFAAYIAQAGVQEAYKYYASTQEPLRERLKSGIYRRFVHGGLELIEYRGVSPAGTALIPTNEAYFMPVGTVDTFMSYFGPANKFSHVNTLGEEAYAFVYKDQKDEKVEIQTESNMINLIRRPACVVRGTAS